MKTNNFQGSDRRLLSSVPAFGLPSKHGVRIPPLGVWPAYLVVSWVDVCNELLHYWCAILNVHEHKLQHLTQESRLCHPGNNQVKVGHCCRRSFGAWLQGGGGWQQVQISRKCKLLENVLVCIPVVVSECQASRCAQHQVQNAKNKRLDVTGLELTWRKRERERETEEFQKRSLTWQRAGAITCSSKPDRTRRANCADTIGIDICSRLIQKKRQQFNTKKKRQHCQEKNSRHPKGGNMREVHDNKQRTAYSSMMRWETTTEQKMRMSLSSYSKLQQCLSYFYLNDIIAQLQWLNECFQSWHASP